MRCNGHIAHVLRHCFDIRIVVDSDKSTPRHECLNGLILGQLLTSYSNLSNAALQHYGNDVELKCAPQFLRHIVATDGVLERQVKVVCAVDLHSAVFV